jgi:hypothetical protein
MRWVSVKLAMEAPWLEPDHHLPGGAAYEEERERGHAAQRQIRPEPELPEPWAQRAVADEHQVAGHEERDEDAVEQALEGRSQGGLTGQEVEDGRDHARDENDCRELPHAGPGTSRSHAAASIALPARRRQHPGLWTRYASVR